MLDKIISERKREDILRVLHAVHPSHKQRLWLVGFLDYVGYNLPDILGIIASENRWKGYDRDKTAYQASSVITGKSKTHSSRKQKEPITIDDLIGIFKRNTSPTGRMTIPSTILWAAVYYYLEGYIPLPKDRDAKRPGFNWKRYQEKPPTLEEILSWDWSNGLCLLANDKYSFIDIDTRGYEQVFKDYHVEFTPRGGLHAFGVGKVKSVNVENVGELKGKGTLIVAYPTQGYKLKW
ncbi:MAG: hypothetical protein OI715_01120 (plasmid) [Candidatus Methanoperedens sp.]|nr:MAG: hypothetical protein OI715_01120 [Candidatus Methanoperedens sp.]